MGFGAYQILRPQVEPETGSDRPSYGDPAVAKIIAGSKRDAKMGRGRKHDQVPTCAVKGRSRMRREERRIDVALNSRRRRDLALPQWLPGLSELLESQSQSSR